MPEPDFGRKLDPVAYERLVSGSEPAPEVKAVALPYQAPKQDPYAGYQGYEQYAPNQIQPFSGQKPTAQYQGGGAYQPKYSAADIEAKVQEAAAAGVPENEIYDILRSNAASSKDAQTRGILLQGGYNVAGGARDNFAGNITQAGQRNQTFTPTSAVGGIGDALARRGATEAQYFDQMSDIEREKFDAERIERHRREERAREDALREEGYNREDFKFGRQAARDDFTYGRGVDRADYEYDRGVDLDTQLRAEQQRRGDYEYGRDTDRADYEYGRGVDRADFEYDRDIDRSDFEYDRGITREDELIEKGLTADGKPVTGAGGSGGSGGANAAYAGTYDGSDGNTYTQFKDGSFRDPSGNPLPEGVTVQKSTDFKSSVFKEVTKLSNQAKDFDLAANRFDLLKERIAEDPGTAGLFGRVAEWGKGIAGAQGDISTWKTQVTELINTNIINNLPPGIASDRDIQIIQAGFPDNSWNQDQLIEWIGAYQNVLRGKATRDQFQARWIEQNPRNTTGWKDAYEAEYGVANTAPTRENSPTSSQHSGTTSSGVGWKSNAAGYSGKSGTTTSGIGWKIK